MIVAVFAYFVAVLAVAFAGMTGERWPVWFAMLMVGVAAIGAAAELLCSSRHERKRRDRDR